MAEFTTKRGKLTAYAFACGYVESKSNTIKKVELYMEHTVYHVKSIYIGGSYDQWETFVKLKDARKFYNNIKI